MGAISPPAGVICVARIAYGCTGAEDRTPVTPMREVHSGMRTLHNVTVRTEATLIGSRIARSVVGMRPGLPAGHRRDRP